MWVWVWEIRVGRRSVKRSERDFNTQVDALTAGVKHIRENPVTQGDNPEPVFVITLPQLVGGSQTTHV